MAPIKSSLARTVGKLLGVQKDTDLSLRGDVQSNRVPIASAASGGTVSDGVAPGNGFRYHLFLEPGNLEVPTSRNVDVLVIAGRDVRELVADQREADRTRFSPSRSGDRCRTHSSGIRTLRDGARTL